MRRMMPPVLGWIGLAIAGLIAGVGAILGFSQQQPAQLVIVYTAATFALVLWAWNPGRRVYWPENSGNLICLRRRSRR